MKSRINEIKEKYSESLKLRGFNFIDINDPISISIAYMFISLNTFTQQGKIINHKFGNATAQEKMKLPDIVEHYTAYSVEDMLEVFLEFYNDFDALGQNKKTILREINYCYSNYKNEGLFDWISGKDNSQIEWLGKYIDKERQLRHYKRRTRVFEKKELIHLALPSLVYVIGMSSSDRELLSIKMRRAWGQVKYREKVKKENKVSFNFVTDKKTREKLKKLSVAFDLTMNETLDRLINATHDSALCKPKVNNNPITPPSSTSRFDASTFLGLISPSRFSDK